ncbi:MAG: hypothetical protein ACXVHS_03205 [Methanobacterium sp.]
MSRTRSMRIFDSLPRSEASKKKFCCCKNIVFASFVRHAKASLLMRQN